MCRLCETNPVYEFTNKRKVCKTCYIHWFEKKFLYMIRKYKMLEKGEKIKLPSGDGLYVVVLQELMTLKKPYVQVSQRGKIVGEQHVDSIAEEFVSKVISSRKKFIPLPTNKHIINPLYLFTKKEIELYARLKGLEYKSAKEDKNKINKFLNSLESKHREVKRAVVQSYLKLSLQSL